jgi:hypothetical protein
LFLEQLMAGAPGRREGAVFPILLPIIVIVLVVCAISALGTTLLSVAAIDKNNAIVLALTFTILVMVLCSFIYVLGERKAHQS